MGGWANEWADDYSGASNWGGAQHGGDQWGNIPAYSLGSGMRGLATLSPALTKTQNQFSPISDNPTEVPMAALIVRKKKNLKKHKKKFGPSPCGCKEWITEMASLKEQGYDMEGDDSSWASENYNGGDDDPLSSDEDQVDNQAFISKI